MSSIYEAAFSPLRPNLRWMARAACRGRDPYPWFTTSVACIEEARAVCADCPVSAVCLGQRLEWEDAIGHVEDGMFGGKTPGERRELLGMRR